MEKLSWKFEAITVLACFVKLKSRFELIGKCTITSYISLALLEKIMFNFLLDIQKLL